MHLIRNRKIALVIDDSEDARIIYSAALKSIGFETIPLASLPNQDFFENRAVDLILLDMQLGKINTLSHLQELSRNSDAKIVVLTAFGSIEKAVEAVRK